MNSDGSESQPDAAKDPGSERPSRLPPMIKQRTATHASDLVGEVVIAAADGALRVPFSVVLEANNDLLVMSFLPDGAPVVDRFRSNGTHAGVVAKIELGDAPGQLRSPAGVAVDDLGNLYFTDNERNRVLKFSPQGKFLEEFGADGQGPRGLLGPRDVEIANDGRIAVADTKNHRIQVWEADGTFVAAFGAHKNSFDEGNFLPSGRGQGEFFNPFGVTFDTAGMIWIADTNNHRIQKLDPETGTVTGFGRDGRGVGDLSFPMDVRIDSHGLVVVADYAGRRIQWFRDDGTLERAIDLREAMPPGAPVADVDVDENGVVYIPVGPVGKIFKVRAGEPIA